MEETKLAVTLFNLREYCKTESDLDETLDKVCAIGYKAVQVSGVSLPNEVIKKQLDKHNLICCATHENMAGISGDISLIIDRLNILDCDFAALGSPTEEYRYTVENITALANIFNEQGAKMMAQGKRLGYHNHHFEFFPVAGVKKSMLELFYELTNPEHVFAELDVHWVTRGGGSPVNWIHRMNGRMPVIHFKDFNVEQDGTPYYCEIGEGNLDWPGIIKACEETNVRWYSIEQDQPFKDRCIFESIKMSYDYLTSLGVK